MKAFLSVSVAAFVLSAVLLYFIGKQNDIASRNDDSKNYLSFNWNQPQVSQRIMNEWRADAQRTNAVKNLIYLDYVFMLIYTFYFLYVNQYRRKKEQRQAMKRWLQLSVYMILLALLLDFVQDTLILYYVTHDNQVLDMRYFTYPKWTALFFGILPLVISFFSAQRVRIASQFFGALFLFFPAILFLLLAIFCFWSLGQGKDVMIAFIDNDVSKSNFHFARFYFLFIIGFWVYVSWYSSRIIAYTKKKQQQQKLIEITHITEEQAEAEYNNGNNFFDIGKPYLDWFPRLIGNACFLILELAVLQLPILRHVLLFSWAWAIFAVLLIALYFLNRYIERRLMKEKKDIEKTRFYKVFLLLLFVLLGYTAALCFAPDINVMYFFILLLLFHVVFIFYINLRRADMEQKATVAKEEKKQEERGKKVPWLQKKLEAIMDFFCVPRREKGYYGWFLAIGFIGIVIYTLNILYLSFAREVGPFPTVILSFAVLLAFGNLVTAFSVRYKSNFHFPLFILAIVIGGFHETHYVKTLPLPEHNNNYDSSRPDLKEYLTAWLNEKHITEDSTGNAYDVYFIMANGGASRSGYWTASVLDSLEDASLKKGKADSAGSRFSDHIFCLSGTSGGGVGVATFFALLRNKGKDTAANYTSSAKAFLQQDYFTYTFARMLGPDFFNYLVPFVAKKDRARALEESFEESSKDSSAFIYPVPFDDKFSHFPACTKDFTSVLLPILCINTTRMDDGTPGVVTNLNLHRDSILFDNRVDVLHLLDKEDDISLASAAILGARFPYISPAGRINHDYFVDGGYFDNSGAGVVQEMIRGIINIGKEDSTLSKQINKLRFKVIHITNSPIILDSAQIINRVAPIKNDLLAPILTIIGAYNMQTTVNDARLMNFISDLKNSTKNGADYTQIPLYEDTAEWKKDTLRSRFSAEPSYAMNWFMSDTTRHRIDKRLQQPDSKLDSMINVMKW